MAKILALDYGTKRIGVAVSDINGRIAFPREFIGNDKREDLLGFIRDEEIERVVIGLPKSLSGQESKSAQDAREFAEWLGKNSKMPIEFIDERFTTKEIQAEMKNLEVKSKKYRKEIDSMVAQKMLERYLSKLNLTPSQSPTSFQEGEKSRGGFLPHASGSPKNRKIFGVSAKGERKRG